VLGHKAGDKVIHFALPACDGHGAIIGEDKAKSKSNS